MKYIPALLIAALIALVMPPSPIHAAPLVKPLQPAATSAASMPIAEPPQPTTVAQEPQAYYPITAWERALICRVMMSECAGEPPEGQLAVAQVILDRLQSDDFPGTVYEVLTQDGQFAAPSEEDVTEEINEAVSAVFDRGERVTEVPLYWFYNPAYGWSRFHEAQTLVLEIGHHKFYK